MYYSGFPFNDYSLIKELPSNPDEALFRSKKVDLKLGSVIYERIFRDTIDLVVYINLSWNDPELLNFHHTNYKDISYFTENKVGLNVYKVTIISNGKIKGYNIVQYDDNWRSIIEQSFDENHLLLEYRQMYYEEKNRIPCKEKIFFSSWHISEENY
jgi:hypothetical protein